MKRISCVIDNHALPESGLQAEHGLSFWIETEQGTLIFDTGQSAAAFTDNLAKLGLDAATVRALASSHAHYDHTGGMLALLDRNPHLKIFANQDLLRPRYSLREGEYRQIGLQALEIEELQQSDLHLSDAPQEILPKVWTSGRISQRPHKEGRSAHHFIRVDESWQPDPYADDLSLVVHHPKGLILICGCCHAGLLNTLLKVKETFSGEITHILGGTHLLRADEAELQHVAATLQRDHPNVLLYLNHCTGDNAQRYLRDVLGERVLPFPAGANLIVE